MFRKSCVAVFCVALFGPAASAGAASVVDRDEFSTTTQVSDGRFRTSVSSQPLNFQTVSGAWKAIDTTLEPGGDGTVAPAAVDGDVSIPATLADPVELTHHGEELSVRLKGSAGGRDGVEGAGAEFQSALAGVDVAYVSTPQGVKETLRLASTLGPKVFSYDVRGDSDWTATVDGGDVVFRAVSGAERYRIAAPLAWDSAPDPAFTNALELSVAKVSAGRWTVTLTPDADWLSDSARVAPIFIDPDYSWSSGTTHFHGAQDCYLSGNTQADNSFCAQTYLQTGYYNRRYKSIFKFAIASAIPSNATVSAATFKAYGPPQSVHGSGNHSLSTITSDWDSTATWNERKDGVPWTTPGGDVSTNPALKSASTAVQASSAWYSWSAPLAAVQGWVNGTLPNYGFLLQTDAGAPSNNAYVWASSEASTSSSFPATSAEWPTLDVTWTAPSGADTTAPTAPTDLALLRLDTTDGVAGFNFTPGTDAGAGASGVDRNEYRVRRAGETSFSAWMYTDGDGYIDELTNGQGVELQVRTVDIAGNVSATTSGAFTATAGSNAAAYDEGARAWLTQAYGMSATAAQNWVDAQSRALDMVEDIKASSAATSYAGVWFDNAAQKIHVKLLSSAHNAAVQGIAANHQLTPYLTLDVAPVTEAQLAQASNDAQDQLASEHDDGWVDIGYSVAQSKVTFEVATDAPSTARNSIATAVANLAVPTSVTDADGPRAQPIEQACGPQNDPSVWSSEVEGGRRVGCGPPFRGGSHLGGHNGDPCTIGFNVRKISDGKPYVMTAGHCYEEKEGESDLGNLQFASMSNDGSVAIGPLRGRVYSSTFWAFTRYQDVAVIEATEEQTNKLRPWIYYSHITTGEGNPQMEIGGVGFPFEGQTLCFSGATTGSHCGTVKDIGKAHNNAGYIQMCTPQNMGGRTLGGDSGGPFISKTSGGQGLAVGMLSGLPKGDDTPKHQCLAQFSYALTNAARLGMDIRTTYNTDRDGNIICRWPESDYGGVCRETW